MIILTQSRNDLRAFVHEHIFINAIKRGGATPKRGNSGRSANNIFPELHTMKFCFFYG